jgi:GAF domain-containing protein
VGDNPSEPRGGFSESVSGLILCSFYFIEPNTHITTVVIKSQDRSIPLLCNKITVQKIVFLFLSYTLFVMEKQLPSSIKKIFDSDGARTYKIRRTCETIRSIGNYRWVGIYDVTENEIINIAWSGPGAPANPRFPISQGLSSWAVANKKTVVSNDVANDSRYLTAFESTGSEIIVLIIEAKSGKVIGTIDVESEEVNAFALSDQQLLEKCAEVIAPNFHST